MKRLLIAACIALAGCATLQPGATRADAINAAAEVAASIADATAGAPPVTLAKTEIDERLIRAALHTFEGATNVIERLLDGGKIAPGRPTALRIEKAGNTVQAALNGAHAAQKAGNATSYRAALEQGRIAAAELQRALAGL